MGEPQIVKQCRSCPWRVDCDPTIDIPNGYSVRLHMNLRGTIAKPGSVCDLFSAHRIMACHYSLVGQEIPCAGWMNHQLGVGNNIWLRLAVMRGAMPAPDIYGEQHQTFEATLPRFASSRGSADR